MATIALDAGKVVLKDGKASCTCCGPECVCDPETEYGIVLTEEEYNNFKQGGNYTMSATLSENYFGDPYTCSSNLNGSGTLLGGCNFSSSVSEPKCSGSYYNSAYLFVSWNVCKEESTGLYKLNYGGDAACPYTFFQDCYSVGYWINDSWDYYGPPSSGVVSIGTVTINNRGSQVQFNVWAFSSFNSNPGASASGAITITP